VLLLDEVNVHNELVVKWFEMQQLGLPSAALAVLVSPLLSDRLSLAETARTVRLAQKYRLVLNVYWEEHFHTPLDALR
jgi:ubiquinone biosynthesis protein COQ4